MDLERERYICSPFKEINVNCSVWNYRGSCRTINKMAGSATPMLLTSCYLLLLMTIWMEVGAVHFENGFNADKILVDALEQKVQLRRSKRDILVKHKTQHLKPAIEIEPINEKTKVAMPHFNVQDLTAYASQAAAAIATRFDEFEPTLLASNGQ